MVILFSGLAGFACGYVALSSWSDAKWNRQLQLLQAKWQAENEQLKSELQRARQRPVQIEHAPVPVEVPVARGVDPSAVLEKLIHLNAEPNRVRRARLLVHHLEVLVEAGPQALPVIREFLNRRQDVEFTGERTDDEDRRRRFGGGDFRRTTDLEFTVPPSLRLGLFDVLAAIGGPESEQILAETLAVTGRGIEVAYVARLLDEMAPNKYHELALNAAKDLLAHPIKLEDPSRLDESAKAHLYQILRNYNDRSFVPVAQGLLIGQDGRIDRSALGYLTDVLNDQALPYLSQAFRDPRLTNQADRMTVARQGLNHVGANPHANDLLNAIVTDESLPSPLRSLAVQSLTGRGRGRDQEETPTDPQLLISRLQVIEAIKPGVTDERVLRALDQTSEDLQALIQGKTLDRRRGDRRSFRGFE